MSNMPSHQSGHQAGLTALYLGIFATVWFSVPAVDQPWRALLVVGERCGHGHRRCWAPSWWSGAGASRWRSRRTRAADRRYLLIVVAEFAAAGLGAVLLAAAERSEYIPVLVCAVVGLHFFPLVPVLRDPLLRPLGSAMCVRGRGGARRPRSARRSSAGLVVGTGAGLLLLGYARAGTAPRGPAGLTGTRGRRECARTRPGGDRSAFWKSGCPGNGGHREFRETESIERAETRATRSGGVVG